MLVVLSGMSDEAQMADNLATVHNLEPLSAAERDAIAEVTRQLLDKPTRRGLVQRNRRGRSRAHASGNGT